MGLLDLGLRPPSAKSQLILNQPNCKIQVPAFWGLCNSQPKKRLGESMVIVTRSSLHELTPTNEPVTIQVIWIWLSKGPKPLGTWLVQDSLKTTLSLKAVWKAEKKEISGSKPGKNARENNCLFKFSLWSFRDFHLFCFC